MGQMAQLMDDHIIQDGGRCQHEPPVKRECASGAAASPASLLIPDGDAVVGATGELVEMSHSFRKIFFCRGNIALFQGEPLGIGQLGDGTVTLFFLNFQIFGDDPDTLLDEQMGYFFLGGAHGNAHRDLPVGGNTDGEASAVAADEYVRQLVKLTLILDAYCAFGLICHR